MRARNNAGVPDDAELRALLAEAADTLRRLPSGLRRARLSSWPPVVRQSASLLGPSEEGRTRPAAPSPQAIDRMDRVLPWLYGCDEEARRLIWARANRVPWRRLEDLDGRSHTTLRLVVARGLAQVRERIRAETSTMK